MDFVNKSEPTVCGLVLAGGRSTRMGEDKGLLEYFGKPQRIYCYELLESLGLEAVHMSCRRDQEEHLAQFQPVPDQEGKTGPIFILENIFQLYPKNAWLLFPCDVPLMSQASLRFLIQSRNTSAIATAFKAPDGKPEPLLAIWEPGALPFIEDRIARASYSPRQLLLEEHAHLIDPPDPTQLLNANTVEERARIELMIERRQQKNRRNEK